MHLFQKLLELGLGLDLKRLNMKRTIKLTLVGKKKNHESPST